MQNLRELPKFRDSWSYLYVEHCKIDREDKAIAVHDARGKVPVPCATLGLLMLGPGTSITHAAVQALADNGCLVLWTGEQGIRCYAQGMGENRSADRLIRQAKMCSDPGLHLKVVVKMYEMRFGEPIPDGVTLEQIRGREGARVRDAYAKASKETGVPWTGRSYNRDDWTVADPVNRALSAANSCLYGICHAAILSLGYSPGLGFIHTGKQLSFVYDVADLYKADLSIPLAFRAAASYQEGEYLEGKVRRMMRDAFAETQFLKRVVLDLDEVFNIEGWRFPQLADEYDEDAAKPGGLWDPKHEILDGGVNYGSDPDEEGT